jgi:hypothetical protein
MILATTLATYQPPVYEGYVYGEGAKTFGWLIASVPFLPIPVYIVYKLVITRGSFMEVGFVIVGGRFSHCIFWR